MRLDGKVALITGAGSGIGRATTRRFAEEGAKVVASDMNEIPIIEAVQEIKRAGGEAVFTTGDISDSTHAERMVQTAVQAFGRLDVLVNSAGISARNALPAGASPEAIWDKVIDVNLKGTYLMSWYAVPEMEKSGGGSEGIVGCAGMNPVAFARFWFVYASR